MRRGRAQPCLDRRARSLITLCQRYANALLEKNKTLDLTPSYIFFFYSESDLHSLTPCLRGEVDPGETLPLNNPPFLPAPVFRYIVDLAFSLVFSQVLRCQMWFYHSARGSSHPGIDHPLFGTRFACFLGLAKERQNGVQRDAQNH